MKSHVRVAVIGGGVVGCSVLYHLTKLGWSDVCLIERKELTAGSSWHAAGGFHALNSDPGIAKLQSYTIALYKEIEEYSEQSVGMHMTGGLNIAATPARWELLKADFAKHAVLGLQTEMLGPSEIKQLCPLIDVTNVLGALYDRHEGHVDPSGVTYAYAKAARKNGAEIYRHTRVTDLKPTGRGTWRVITDAGEIEAEHVVNAAGLWAREMGAMVGAQLPLVPMEHHYIVTDPIREVKDFDGELPLIVDLDNEIYMRQEGQGMLVGVYEKDATPWALAGTPWDYGETDLLPPALERISDALMKGYERFPAVANAQIRRIVNGPFTFTPDGNPLVGPVPGVKNYWSACGVMAGFAQGGGVGLSLAEWIINGEPGVDIFAMDVARFGDYATPQWVTEKASEFYSKRFVISYPNEFWPAGREVRTDPLFAILKEKNAVFGVSYGVEVPLYFAPEGEAAVETPSLGRSNAFDVVGQEIAAVSRGVGVLDASSFAKYEITGPDAAAALDRLIANRLPSVGRIRLAPLLAPSGRLMGDLTLMRLAEDRFALFGSGYLQNWHGRWFDEQLAGDGVVLTNRSDDWQALVLAGPKSRELIARISDVDVAPEAFKPMTVKQARVAGTEVLLARLSLSGELSFEIYMPRDGLIAVYEEIERAGADLGLVDFGIHAYGAMRLEKGFGIWSREFTWDQTPGASGLDRFIAFDKPDFIGKEAALAEREAPSRQTLVTFVVDDTDADATGYEPVLHDGERVGYVTSGGYGFRVGKSIAMAYIDRSAISATGIFEIPVLGQMRRAHLVNEPLFDPSGNRMRA